MHYRDLFKAAEIYRDNTAWDSAYFEFKDSINWLDLHNLSNNEVKSIVIGFLNNWKCRIPATENLAERIKNTYKQAIPYLAALNSETLGIIDFNQKKDIVGEREQLLNSKIVYIVFSMFSNIGDRFRWVATSKMLHLINPKLFVMWDNPICDAYHLQVGASSYAYEFLPKMKEEANEVITTYMKDYDNNRDEAIKQIESKYGKTLAKLIDEYNWIKYTGNYKF